MPSAQRLIVELSTYSLQAAVAADGRVTACREFAPDDGASLASFITEHAAGAPVELALLAPAAGFAGVIGADETASLGAASALLERAPALGGGAGAPVAACDVVNGRIPVGDGSRAWLLAGVSAEAAEAAGRQLAALGLAPAAVAPALPAELGAVVELVRATPGAGDVAVWVPGESSGRLCRVSSEGIQSVAEVPAGWTQIFEAVQAELGLKFRAAATKLFFNANYEFGEAGERIAGRLAALLRDGLGGTAAFHAVGLPAGQAWLVREVAKSLGVAAWTPDEAAAQARYGVSAELLSPGIVGLLQAAVSRAGGEWVPVWLTPDTVLSPTVAPAPAVVLPVTPPAPAPAPEPKPVVAAATPKPAPVRTPAKPVPPAPKPVKASAPAAAPAPVQAKPVAPKAVVAAPSPARSTAAPAPANRAPAAKGRKFPLVPVAAGVVVVGLLVGGAMFFLKSDAPPAKTASAAKTAKPAAVSAPAPVSVALQPSVQLALLESEVKRDPMGFKGDYYAFSVSNKGVLTNLQTTGRTAPWIRNLGFMRLYGVTLQADGRRTVRKAGDMSSSDYRAKVVKRVRDGVVVFDVDVAHPKFTFTQTFVCLPRSLKVELRFKPAALSDANGPLDAVYGVHFDTADFVSPAGKPQARAGELVYGTKKGPLSLRYDPAFTGAGSQPVVGDPALASFVLAVAGGTTEQVLNYEIVLP